LYKILLTIIRKTAKVEKCDISGKEKKRNKT
ncbi:hypothetical protein T09_14024, partial [Trichinella sp. T9]